MSQIKQIYKTAIFWVILGSFLASLLYAFHFKIEPSVDALAYDKIAWNLIKGNGYRESLENNLSHDYAIARVGPFYEYFLAGIYKIFGRHYELVWLIQAILHALSAWLIFLTTILVLADNQKRKTAGLWAAAIFGFYPDLIEISAMLMTETLFLFLVCLMIYLFFCYIGRPTNQLAAGLALVAGLAVLTRSPVFFLIPVILFYFWRKKLWRQAAIFVLVLILVFIPWTWRNYQIYGQLMPFGAAGNFNFWIGNRLGGDGEQGPTNEQIEFVTTRELKEVNSESTKQFKSFLYSHPLEFIKLTCLRINKYFSVIRPMGFWFYQEGLGQLLFILSSAAASVILFVFGLGGILKTIFLKDKRLYYPLAFAIFTPLIIFVTVVETRYRFQIYPLLAIFAGYFMVRLTFNQTKWWLERTLWLSAALVFSNGIIDLLLSLARLKERLKLFF